MALQALYPFCLIGPARFAANEFFALGTPVIFYFRDWASSPTTADYPSNAAGSAVRPNSSCTSMADLWLDHSHL